MFEGKYGKTLTIAMIVLIVLIIGILIFFAADYLKNTKINSDAQNAADRFEGSVNGQIENDIDNSKENKEVENVEVNIKNEEITGGTTSKNEHNGFETVGTIEIPKIELKYPVLKDANKDSIEQSVAINAGPGLNKVGNTVIIGHNYRNGTFFSNNKNLSNGDKVYITDEKGTRIEYIIYKTYTTSPEDSEYMDRDTQDKREITLVTCTDDTKSRLVIWAKEN